MNTQLGNRFPSLSSSSSPTKTGSSSVISKKSIDFLGLFQSLTGLDLSKDKAVDGTKNPAQTSSTPLPFTAGKSSVRSKQKAAGEGMETQRTANSTDLPDLGSGADADLVSDNQSQSQIGTDISSVLISDSDTAQRLSAVTRFESLPSDSAGNQASSEEGIASGPVHGPQNGKPIGVLKTVDPGTISPLKNKKMNPGMIDPGDLEKVSQSPENQTAEEMTDAETLSDQNSVLIPDVWRAVPILLVPLAGNTHGVGDSLPVSDAVSPKSPVQSLPGLTPKNSPLSGNSDSQPVIDVTTPAPVAGSDDTPRRSVNQALPTNDFNKISAQDSDSLFLIRYQDLKDLTGQGSDQTGIDFRLPIIRVSDQQLFQARFHQNRNPSSGTPVLVNIMSDRDSGNQNWFQFNLSDGLDAGPRDYQIQAGMTSSPTESGEFPVVKGLTTSVFQPISKPDSRSIRMDSSMIKMVNRESMTIMMTPPLHPPEDIPVQSDPMEHADALPVADPEGTDIHRSNIISNPDPAPGLTKKSQSGTVPSSSLPINQDRRSMDTGLTRNESMVIDTVTNSDSGRIHRDEIPIKNQSSDSGSSTGVSGLSTNASRDQFGSRTDRTAAVQLSSAPDSSNRDFHSSSVTEPGPNHQNRPISSTTPVLKGKPSLNTDLKSDSGKTINSNSIRNNSERPSVDQAAISSGAGKTVSDETSHRSSVPGGTLHRSDSIRHNSASESSWGVNRSENQSGLRSGNKSAVSTQDAAEIRSSTKSGELNVSRPAVPIRSVSELEISEPQNRETTLLGNIKSASVDSKTDHVLVNPKVSDVENSGDMSSGSGTENSWMADHPDPVLFQPGESDAPISSIKEQASLMTKTGPISPSSRPETDHSIQRSSNSTARPLPADMISSVMDSSKMTVRDGVIGSTNGKDGPNRAVDDTLTSKSSMIASSPKTVSDHPLLPISGTGNSSLAANSRTSSAVMSESQSTPSSPGILRSPGEPMNAANSSQTQMISDNESLMFRSESELSFPLSGLTVGDSESTIRNPLPIDLMKDFIADGPIHDQAIDQPLPIINTIQVDRNGNYYQKNFTSLTLHDDSAKSVRPGPVRNQSGLGASIPSSSSASMDSVVRSDKTILAEPEALPQSPSENSVLVSPIDSLDESRPMVMNSDSETGYHQSVQSRVTEQSRSMEKNTQLNNDRRVPLSDLSVAKEHSDYLGREKDTGMDGTNRLAVEPEHQGIRSSSAGDLMRTENTPESQSVIPSIQPVKPEWSPRNSSPAYLMHSISSKEVFDKHRAEKPSDPSKSEVLEAKASGVQGFETREIKISPVKRSQTESRVEGEPVKSTLNPETNQAESTGSNPVIASVGNSESLFAPEITESTASQTAEETPSRQLFQHLKMIINHQQKEAVIHLKPESLGKVIVHLKMDGSEAEALFQVENEEVHHQLKRSMDQLVESMKEQNITLTKTEIAIVPAEKSSSHSLSADQTPVQQEESAQTDQQSSHQRQHRKDTQDLWDDWEKHKRSRRFNSLA